VRGEVEGTWLMGNSRISPQKKQETGHRWDHRNRQTEVRQPLLLEK
jgi:hypothetical protein